MLLYNAQEPTDFESYQEQGDIGFTDVAGAQIDTFMYEDLSNSRERNLDAELWKEVYKAHDLAPEMFGPKSIPQTNPNAPKILQDAWNDTAQGQDALRLSDWEGMVEPNLEALKERFPDANIRNREEIDTDIAAQAKAYRDEIEEITSYADPYAAFFGTLAGAAVASMADPINMMTLPLGAGNVAGASFIKGLGIVVARNFGIGFATEAALQPLVYDYKKEIESPYDLQDALFNMAAAGVGNGLLNGLGHTIGRGFDKITSKQELPDTHETRKLRKDIQTLLELQTFADETGAKTVAELEVHLKALNTAMADVAAGKQIDFDALGEAVDQNLMQNLEAEFKAADSEVANINQKRDQLTGQTNNKLSVNVSGAKVIVTAGEQVVGSFDIQEKNGFIILRSPLLNDISSTTAISAGNSAETYLAIAKANPSKQIKSGELTEEAVEVFDELFKQGRATREVDDSIHGYKYTINSSGRKSLSDTEAAELDSLNFQLKEAEFLLDDINAERGERLALKAQDTSFEQAFAPTDSPLITGLKPQLKKIDEALNNEAIDAEAARIVVDETNDQVIFDQNGNTINLRDALMEDDTDIAAIESMKVCML